VGVATFKLRDDGTALQFKLNVANIDNVFAAHIHCGAVGVNGPVGVTLFMGSPAGGVVNGTLAQGTSTAPDASNACGWVDLAAVLAAMDSGDTYVNVHTNHGVAPPNTGPGDFPPERSAARSGKDAPSGQSEEVLQLLPRRHQLKIRSSRSGCLSSQSRHRAHQPSASAPFPQHVVM
jgi:hypothetical protein